MSRTSTFGIRRSDGLWYIGTVDFRPVFSVGTHVARFEREDLAALRMKGLVADEDAGRAFGVVPIEHLHDDLERLADQEQRRDSEGGVDA